MEKKICLIFSMALLSSISLCQAADPGRKASYWGRFQALAQRVAKRCGIAQRILATQAEQDREQLREHLTFTWKQQLVQLNRKNTMIRRSFYFMQLLYNDTIASDGLDIFIIEQKPIVLPDGQVWWVNERSIIEPDSRLWKAIQQSNIDGYSPYSAVIVSPDYSRFFGSGKTLKQKKMLISMLEKAGVQPTEKDYEMSHLDLWERSAEKYNKKSALVFAWQEKSARGQGIGILPLDALKLIANALGHEEPLLPDDLINQ